MNNNEFLGPVVICTTGMKRGFRTDIKAENWSHLTVDFKEIITDV